MITKTKREHEAISTVDVGHGDKAVIRTIMRCPDIDSKATLELREKVFAFHRELDHFNQIDAFDRKDAEQVKDGQTVVDTKTGELIPIPELGTIESALWIVCHQAEGAIDRWSERRMMGLEDHALSEAIKFEIGEISYFEIGDDVPFMSRYLIPNEILAIGKRAPQLWFDIGLGGRSNLPMKTDLVTVDIGELRKMIPKNPHLRAGALLRMARDIFRVDRPGTKRKRDK